MAKPVQQALSEPNSPRIAIILVNWNGWQDTIECVESVLRADGDYHIIVVDNASADGSLNHLKDWASGTTAWEPPAGPLRRLTDPPLPKPLAFNCIDAATALSAPLATDARVTFIDAGANLGYAGGNNVGMRHALNSPNIDYFWCLNNDTVIEPSAVQAVLARMDATHKVGMCGTQVRYYHRPGNWQMLNGRRFHLLTGQSTAIAGGEPVTRPFDARKIARETDFVLGASLIVSRPFLQTVGLMEESYFLYYEEMDWSVRNQGRFETAFAHTAIVYHKEGGSIGSSGKAGNRSELSEYYMIRSRLKFYKRNFPLLLPLQYPQIMAQIVRRILRRQPGKAWAMMRAMLGLSRG